MRRAGERDLGEGVHNDGPLASDAVQVRGQIVAPIDADPVGAKSVDGDENEAFGGRGRLATAAPFENQQ
jgi:hypothetical protein